MSIERAAQLVQDAAAELSLNPSYDENGIPGATLALEITRITGIQIHVEYGYRKLKDFIVNHCQGLQVVTSRFGDMRVRVARHASIAPPPTAECADIALPQRAVEWIGAIIRGQPHRRTSRDLSAVVDDYSLRLHVEAEALSQLLGVALYSLERNQNGTTALGVALHALSSRFYGRRQYIAALELRLAAFAAGFESEKDSLSSCVRLALADVDGRGADIGEELLVQGLTHDLKCALGALVARAGQYSTELAIEVLGGKGGLFFAVRDHVASLLSGDNKGVPEHLVFEVHAVELRSRLDIAREAVERYSVGGIGSDLQKVLGPIAKLKGFMLPSELRHLNDVVSAVSSLARSREAVLDKKATLSPPLIQGLQQDIDRLRELCVVALHDGPILYSTVVRLGERCAEDASVLVSDLSTRVRANVRLREVNRRYPIGRVNEDIVVPFELLNDGPGTALNVKVIASVGPGVQADDETLYVGTLRAYQPSAQNLCIRTTSAMRSVRIALAIVFQDELGRDQKTLAELMLDAQTREPDWASLLETRPYTLNPVERRQFLWGRSAQLNRLLLNIATATSSVVWGQKRVGKTSVARVLFNELQAGQAGRGIMSLYLRKGDVAGFDEGQLGHEIAERLVSACERQRGLKFRTVVPSSGEFSGRINRLARVIDDLREAGLQDSVVLILDEFDEMNPHFYFGERGETFFGVLRALTERNVVLILIGSERMPAIIDRHSQLLNKYDIMRVDSIDERADAFQLIEEPVRGHIDFDGAARNRVFELSAGNPYFINLICREILREMVNARRSYVDLADVQSAAALLCGEAASPHWSHFWGDSESYTPVERQRLSGDFANVLLAFAMWPLEVSLSAGELRGRLGAHEQTMSFGLEQVLSLLLKRGIVVSEVSASGMRYNIEPRVFRWWLCECGQVVLGADARKTDARELQPVIEAGTSHVPEFPLTDEDVITVAEGLVYDGVRLDSMRVKLWLRQFGSRERVLWAYSLIKAMRERWYFDATRMGILVDDAYRRAVGRLSPGSQLMIGDAQLAPTRERICLSYFGAALKSGVEYCRMVKKRNRLARSLEGVEALSWLVRQGQRSMVLFLDDVVGTGNQASFLARKLLREVPREAIGGDRIALFVPIFAYQEGVEQFQDIAAPIEIDPVRLLDDSDRAFSLEAGIFSDAEECVKAREMCEEIGAELWPEHPLGYEGMQSLLVLHTAIPNATLPIFWKEGVVRGVRWVPLFPHR